jgi:hypothetical protein
MKWLLLKAAAASTTPPPHKGAEDEVWKGSTEETTSNFQHTPNWEGGSVKNGHLLVLGWECKMVQLLWRT